mgnify:CR=1 FL=1
MKQIILSVVFTLNIVMPILAYYSNHIIIPLLISVVTAIYLFYDGYVFGQEEYKSKKKKKYK